MKISIAHPATGKEEIEAVREVLASGMLAQGPVVAEFERMFEKYCEVPHAIAVNNGTAALHAALAAAGIGPGDEVIVPSFSFIASATCVNMCGGKPIFADVDDKMFSINPEKVKEAISSKTKAVIGVHLYGQPCDVQALTEICRDHNLKFIEDAAQAHGACYKGVRVGGFGDAACFSFYATKNMTTGEGGMITTNDASYAKKVRQFINHGQSQKYIHTLLGYNYRMTDICGAIGLVQLKNLDKNNLQRNINAKIYTNRINVSGLTTPEARPDCYHVYHQYVLKISPDFALTREEFMKHLEECGIGSAVHYPIPIHKQPLYSNDQNYNHCPISTELSECVMSIPVHPLVTQEQANFICKTINEMS